MLTTWTSLEVRCIEAWINVQWKLDFSKPYISKPCVLFYIHKILVTKKVSMTKQGKLIIGFKNITTARRTYIIRYAWELWRGEHVSKDQMLRSGDNTKVNKMPTTWKHSFEVFPRSSFVFCCSTTYQTTILFPFLSGMLFRTVHKAI